MFLQSGYAGRVSLLIGAMLAQMWVSITRRARLIGAGARGTAADPSFLRDLVQAGELKAVIDRTYSLDPIAEAHGYLQSGRKEGNAVIAWSRKARSGSPPSDYSNEMGQAKDLPH